MKGSLLWNLAATLMTLITSAFVAELLGFERRPSVRVHWMLRKRSAAPLNRAKIMSEFEEFKARYPDEW